MPTGQYKRTKYHKDISTSHLPKDLRKEKNPCWKGGKPKCIECGKQLTKYGAKRCKIHAENQKEKIDKISNLLRGKPSWNSGKKYNQISGEKHWNWKGGITPENHKVRTSLEYKLWRKAVFERDNFICQKYGIGGVLHPHHINNFSDFPELRLAIDNGITLSNKAHREFHKKYGNKNNNRKQLEEFLK